MNQNNQNPSGSPSLPKPSGDYSVGTTSYYFTDPEREEIYTEDPNDNRELMVRVWYPSEKVPQGKGAPYLNESIAKAIASASDPSGEELINLFKTIPTNSIINAPLAATESDYPVLLLSHGFGQIPQFNTINAEELASQGYIVVSMNHTYDSAVTIFPEGRVVTQSELFNTNDASKFIELVTQSAGIRAKDAQFVLDELEDINAQDPLGLFTGKLDLDRVGIFGYSLGGAIAAQTLLEDDRFKAGINLDGGLYIDGVDESLNKPFMFMNNEAFGTGNPSDPLVKAQQSFFENLQDDGYELTIRGSNHSNFSDLPLVVKELQDAGLLSGESTADNSKPINPERATQIINDYTVAFFDRYLNNQESPLLEASSSPYPEVIFDFREGDNVFPNPEPIFGTVGKDVIEVEGKNKIVFAGKEDDLIDASQSNGDNHHIYAGEGNDTLILGADSRVFGQEGDDRFFMTGGGDNIISGGAGADQFWIAVAQTPETTNAIADFTNGEDVIGIAGLGIGFEDLTITQQGNNSLITSNGTDLAILQGINANDLSANNFAFV